MMFNRLFVRGVAAPRRAGRSEEDGVVGKEELMFRYSLCEFYVSSVANCSCVIDRLKSSAQKFSSTKCEFLRVVARRNENLRNSLTCRHNNSPVQIHIPISSDPTNLKSTGDLDSFCSYILPTTVQTTIFQKKKIVRVLFLSRYQDQHNLFQTVPVSIYP